MRTHRFVYTSASGHQSSELLEFRNDEMAILCARSLLSKSTVAVGVRRVEGAEEESRVGMWVWTRGEPAWKLGE